MLVAPLHTAAARVQAAFRGKRTRDRVNIRRAPRQGAGQVDGAPEAAGSMQGASGNEAQQKTEALCPGARRASGHSASPWGGSASRGRMARPGFGMPSLPKPSKQYLKKKQKQFTFHSPCASLYHNHVARKSFMPKSLFAPLEMGADAAMLSSTKMAVNKLGNIIRTGLHDPTNPGEQWVLLCFNHVFDIVSRFIQNEVIETYSYKRKRYRKTLQKAWTKGRPPPTNLCEVYPYVRAKVLYAILPANSTVTPSFLVGILLCIIPLYGLNIVIFFILFIMIDKTDEYQLVKYSCMFKALQFFMYGILPVVQQTVEHFICLDHIHDGVPYKCTGMTSFVKGELILEPIRYGTVWVCGYLLATRRAYGGLKQLEALEAVRVDLADGVLDGSKLSKSVDAASSIEATLEEVAEAQQGAREAVGAQKRTGGLLPYLIAYDAFTTLLLILFGWGIILVQGYRWDDWIIWEVVELGRIIQSLLSFPFAIFLLPIAVPLLTGAFATGYDKAGLLCKQLTPTQIRLAGLEGKVSKEQHQEREAQHQQPEAQHEKVQTPERKWRTFV
ncbi:hypothetical protein AB1Y20_003960 [Prymnesium parvum]|uniref:Uncharacterized protein n=1 Tax=Prymnesium parvum TaxID=97485 RepID=A0AB34J8E0_PRYPA